MITEGKYYFGNVMEIAREIYNDLKNGKCKRWDLGGYGYVSYANDDEVLEDLHDGYSMYHIINSFEGWGGIKVLEDYPFDGNDLILISDQYGGGTFNTVVIPEGIDSDYYGSGPEFFIEDIARMICITMDLFDGYNKCNFDGYMAMEKYLN